MVQILSKNILNLLNRKIFCLGDIMLDNYIIGNTNRISPEGPIPVLDIVKEVKMLGGVGNVVRNLSTLATETHLVSLLGNDLMSNEVEKKLNIINVNKDLVRDSNRPTITKSRYISNNQQILRVDKEKTDFIDKKIENKIFNYSKKRILKTDVVIISDYNKGLITKNLLKRIVSFANKNKKPVIIDPKSTDFDKYKGATIVTPNIKELELVVKKKLNSDKEIINISKKLIFKFNFKHLLITMGKSGMMLISKNNKNVIKFDAEAKEVFDVSGAGDTVASFIAAGIGSSLKIEEVIKIANIAAGVVVGKTGTSVAHLSEILLAINKNNYHLSKVMNLNETIKVINFWKEKKEKIGFTNGCFDYLHPGHVSLFKQAKKKCSKLIVAINSDKSIKNNKGPLRPKQKLNIRLQVLNSIPYIDLIIVFSEKTPIEIIKKIKPNLLVKGSDYKENQIIGAKEVKKNKGKILRAKILSNFSSSNIIDEILNTSF
ncbi:MAG: Bifunctional protein HldE [Alphaproteobacteria bacterium MarineAlpha6_Bin6]|nr:MAG: Bifunctional protein HldE [Alphaproteobacteria bacterium MarineAlpha6_Bin6]PPR33633.1 MAG: Bifunctional protein HldE [Alphaproteobacteria bacterium MarineAlpha6_Bin5]|tara:strand:- start:23342 stop:24802 length:1461 start_codon:yes stop_codon:yes gene_type:complete